MKLSATLKFSSSKNCLGIISSAILAKFDTNNVNDVLVYQISDNDISCFLSLTPSSGRGYNGRAEVVLNGLYASKLGLKDNCDVLIEKVKESSPCKSAWIEPLTVDDWEILELHAGEIEVQLLDQLRVVWPGQVFPLWVDGNICIFLKIVKTEPLSKCCVLISSTELFIEPKVRTSQLPPHSCKERAVEESSALSSLENPTEKDSTCQSSSNVSCLYSLLYLKFLKRIVDLIKFLFKFLWKHIPQSLHHLYVLMFPSIQRPHISDSVSSSEKDQIYKNINLVPDGFKLVLRVEPVTFGQNSTTDLQGILSNQPSTIFLHSRKGLSKSINTEIYYVLLTKILSPNEKSTQSNPKRLPVNAVGDKDSKDSGVAKQNYLSENCVVRMYLHSLSKYAMNIDWNAVYCTYYLTVPLSLRRQMNLSVTSKVKLQKLSSIPQFCTNVDSISFDIIASYPTLPQSVPSKSITSSFEEWLASIADGGNPIPITHGTLLVFPVVINQESLNSNNELKYSVEAVVVTIDAKQKPSQSNDNNNVTPITYLLSVEDLHHIKLNFLHSSSTNTLTHAANVDIQLPTESILVYCKGLESEVKVLENFLELALSSKPLANALLHSGNSLCLSCALVSGVKGTGKTVLCRSLLNKFGSSDRLHAYVRTVACGQWRGKKPENVKRHCDTLLDELLWRQPSILLLDDLDQLLPASNGADEERTPDSLYTLQLIFVIKSFLQSLAGKTPHGWFKIPRVAVLITCKSKNTLHPMMTSSGMHLFSKTLQLELPNLTQRNTIFKSIIENFTNYECPDDITNVLEKMEGFSVSDLLDVIRRSDHLIQSEKFFSRADDTQHDVSGKVLCADVINEALIGFTPAALHDAKLHKPSLLTWKDVGGLASVKKKLIEQLVWPVKYRDLFIESGLQTQAGVLLFGPPGCGKTLIAGVVANECGLNFISIKGPELLSKYIGASEAAVRDLFSRAKAAAPCVLFFDEFDSLAPKRGHDSTGVTDRVVNQLLTHLDGVEPLVGVTVMAASSRPDLLDPALLRPGRLDSLLYCPLPNIQERYEILTSLSANMSLHQNIDLQELAKTCESFSGADLKALLYNAQLEAVHETIDHSYSKSSSCSTIKPSSFSPSSPTSSVSASSKLTMEVDDMYHSNGYSSTEDYEHGSVSPTSSTIDEWKHTTADLINSIQTQDKLGHHDIDDENLHSNYQICFNGEAQNEESDQPVGSKTLDSNDECNLLYFPSLYRGQSQTIPADVITMTDSICSSIEPNTTVTSENKMKEEPLTSLIIKPIHIKQALSSTRPSISIVEREQLESMYSTFIRSRERRDASEKNYYKGKPRATLS